MKTVAIIPIKKTLKEFIEKILKNLKKNHYINL